MNKVERCRHCGLPIVEGLTECPQCKHPYKEEVTLSHVRKPVKVVPKGWGQEIWIANNEKYCGKILEIERGKSFSDHFHIKKTETFYVIQGYATLQIREKDGKLHEYQLSKGAIVDITPGLMHKITATCYFVMAEFSTQHDDEDSYRVSRGD